MNARRKAKLLRQDRDWWRSLSGAWKGMHRWSSERAEKLQRELDEAKREVWHLQYEKEELRAELGR